MGHGYVLQLLFGEKCRIDNYSATTEARKNLHRFGFRMWVLKN
jgi:hypothetical protein